MLRHCRGGLVHDVGQLPESEFVELAVEVFAMLADATRVRIIMALRDGGEHSYANYDTSRVEGAAGDKQEEKSSGCRAV
jgi:hypothetical protein